MLMGVCSEGQVFLIFLPPQSGFPNDGIRYQEPDNRYSIPAGSSTRELEITESKCGFIPSSPGTGFTSPDSTAWRIRRRYRLTKGGHPQMVLVHYGRGPAARKHCFILEVDWGFVCILCLDVFLYHFGIFLSSHVKQTH